MTQTSKQVKTVLLLTFLLLNGAITGCGSCKSEKEKLEQGGEKEKLEQKEKVFMQKFKTNFQQDFLEGIEKEIEKFKKNLKENKQEAEKEINDGKESLKWVDELGEKEKSGKLSKKDQKEIQEFSKNFISPGVSAKENLALMKQFFSDCLALLENLKKQAELKK